ncbi:FAD-dependent oxidoreductase [Pyxidicoccus parkwayensis]|uniref:FAD-dependent oxidoreductase n=1 Tax=Pyxidicoccus parkwayensis TaxID=2813578 RepID=A0ABX7P2L8_9BACT|nr:FAD-dependent oxidoreductase [Pyxidicoccus parkwaysis]QSQ24338.1 FAD-dependent oxidoreductase [Pyxidicoccus parkwaysis]
MNSTREQRDVVVIGGGIGGLAAAAILARGGRSVTLVEKAPRFGGRAITTEREGFKFNLGIHVFYAGGPGEAVLRELGVTLSGGQSDRSLYECQDGARISRLPVDADSLATSALLDPASRAELAQLLRQLRTEPLHAWRGRPVSAWLDQHVRHPVVRSLLEAVVRLATYTHAPDEVDAAYALSLVGSQRGALLLDDGWQTLVHGLERATRAAGVELIHGAAVTDIELGPPHTVRLPSRTLHAKAVVVATDVMTAARLLKLPTVEAWAARARPVRAACLDLALRALPEPWRLVVLRLDQPLYYSVHSRSCRLAPGNGALLHLIKYLPLRPSDLDEDAREDRRQLEAWLDELQPGWREVLVASQFLPRIQVSGDAVTAGQQGLQGRPSLIVPDAPGVYLVGDFVGARDHLAHASLFSAEVVARDVLERAA